MQEFITNNPTETELIGERFGKMLKGNEVIAMNGGLGMGKTAFTRGVAKALGICSGVSSPTFALVHQYDGLYTLFHFDMYRVNNLDDLYSTGFFDYIDNGILIIEWSENIKDALPDDVINIYISADFGDDIISENCRKITIDAPFEIK